MDVAGTKSARAEGRVSRNSVRKMLVGRRQDKQIRAHHGEHMEPINVVLVHGGWADGSSWSKVIPLLQDKGFNVTAAQIPLTPIEDDVAITKRLLTAQNGPTVLVGHSYGGIVVSGAGNGSPNVKALVYIAAFALDEGESIEALGKSGPAPAGAAQIRPDANGFLWINRDGFAQAFASDVDPIQGRVIPHDAAFDFDFEKEQLLKILDAAWHARSAADWQPHPMFGPMTVEEWGKLLQIHIDYHLRQFAA